eukprot:COSAG01_NODE_1176_length_11374_cov_476.847805_1_plen_160_part_00
MCKYMHERPVPPVMMPVPPAPCPTCARDKSCHFTWHNGVTCDISNNRRCYVPPGRVQRRAGCPIPARFALVWCSVFFYHCFVRGVASTRTFALSCDVRCVSPHGWGTSRGTQACPRPCGGTTTKDSVLDRTRRTEGISSPRALRGHPARDCTDLQWPRL